MIGEIMAVAKAFAGVRLEEGEEEVLQTLCEESFIRWGGRLREGLSPSDCYEALVPACACTALGSFASLRAAGGALSFQAGDVSVRQEEAEKQSLRLNRQAETLMAPYVKPPGFAFRAVRG